MIDTSRTASTAALLKVAELLELENTVTIPTVSWGSWTGEIVAIRETGPLAPETEVFVTLRQENGEEVELRTDRRYSGYLYTLKDEAPEATDEEAAEHVVRSTVEARVVAGARYVEASKVWRAAGNAGSGFARVSDLEVPGTALRQTHLEVYRSDLALYLEAGKAEQLFRIVPDEH